MSQEKWIDLHMHSTFSDGSHTPTQLVDIAVRKELTAIALADHDSIDGFHELKAAASAAGMEVITGVEMSSEHNGRDLHILGYGVDADDANLLGMLRKFRDTRERRGIMIVEKLGEIGIELDMDAILAKAGDGALGRPHIAEALVEGGYASDFAEVFAKYIGEHCPAYVEKYKITPAGAVEHIKDARGLAFVAHPGYYIDDMAAFEELLDQGFDGIEVLHPHHKNGIVDRLEGIAESRHLLKSGGSDFHGFAGRDNMGEPKVPYNLLEKIKERLAA
jgi:predicted metal-dependent phosphoesterase TrpH